MANFQKYKLKLLFEWGGGCLWCNDTFTRDAYDVGPVEEKLCLSESTLKRLGEMQVWHDTALDWNNPAGPSPWSVEEFENFEKAVAEIKVKIEKELGAKFELEYIQLGACG